MCRMYNIELWQLYGEKKPCKSCKFKPAKMDYHKARSEDSRLISLVFHERPEGKRSVGRPKCRWQLENRGTRSLIMEKNNNCGQDSTRVAEPTKSEKQYYSRSF